MTKGTQESEKHDQQTAALGAGRGLVRGRLCSYEQGRAAQRTGGFSALNGDPFRATPSTWVTCVEPSRREGPRAPAPAKGPALADDAWTGHAPSPRTLRVHAAESERGHGSHAPHVNPEAVHIRSPAEPWRKRRWATGRGLRAARSPWARTHPEPSLEGAAVSSPPKLGGWLAHPPSRGGSPRRWHPSA